MTNEKIEDNHLKKKNEDSLKKKEDNLKKRGKPLLGLAQLSKIFLITLEHK
jgi:hypothetical protein